MADTPTVKEATDRLIRAMECLASAKAKVEYSRHDLAFRRELLKRAREDVTAARQQLAAAKRAGALEGKRWKGS